MSDGCLTPANANGMAGELVLGRGRAQAGTPKLLRPSAPRALRDETPTVLVRARCERETAPWLRAVRSWGSASTQSLHTWCCRQPSHSSSHDASSGSRPGAVRSARLFRCLSFCSSSRSTLCGAAQARLQHMPKLLPQPFLVGAPRHGKPRCLLLCTGRARASVRVPRARLCWGLPQPCCAEKTSCVGARLPGAVS